MAKLTPVSYKRLCCVFEKEGFLHGRTAGDHFVYVKRGCKRPIVIPRYEQVPVFIIKNLIRTAGIDRDRYFDLLNEC